MSRIKVEIKGKFLAALNIAVRISDINYGSHTGNDSLVSILHEARVQWLARHGYSELDMAGASLILAGLAVEYVNESFYGDLLEVSVSAGMITSAGFELYYEVKCTRENKEIVICRAKTDMVCFDYPNRKVKPLPEEARKILS